MTARCAVVAMAVLLVGCQSSMVVLESPSPAAGTVTGAARSFEQDGIAYSIFETQGRVVMTMVNRGEQPVRLLGASSITDAGGAMTFVDGRLLAAGATDKLLVPPTPRPSDRQRRPVAGEVDESAPFEAGIYHDRRTIEAAHDPSSAFEWPLDGAVRVALVWERDGVEVRHEFVMRKVARSS